MDKWDIRFMLLAKEIAGWSKDPSSKIGAVAVDKNRRILGTGYNGFPMKDADNLIEYYLRSIKYEKVIHAEKNLILNCLNSGVSLKDANIYIWGQAVCKDCAKELTQTGIKAVFSAWNEKSDASNRWKNEWKEHSTKYFKTSGIKYHAVGKHFEWNDNALDIVAIENAESKMKFVLRNGETFYAKDKMSGNFEKIIDEAQRYVIDNARHFINGKK